MVGDIVNILEHNNFRIWGDKSIYHFVVIFQVIHFITYLEHSHKQTTLR